MFDNYQQGLFLRAERVWLQQREVGLRFTHGDLYEIGQRLWQRLPIEKATTVNFDGEPYNGTAIEISAGGASITGIGDNVGGDKVGLAIDQFGEFNASVVRKWDDGVAVTFDHNQDDQINLQEELDDFRSKNDLEWD